MNLITTKTIGDLILNENTPIREEQFEHYLIPYYQRGYRWESRHVLALLDDIYNFIESDEKYYCLQPIVVAPNCDSENNNIWEIIDGQQRLISLYIIFQYINKPRYSILFGQRDKSTLFLKELSSDNYCHDNPDFHFMSNSFEEVTKWFENKSKSRVGFVDKFYSKVTEQVQVIWYELNELNQIFDNNTNLDIEEYKINIFNRLNIGKIPLTDSELIKALLMSKIKIGLTNREAIMRQSEISNEWNLIERELRNDKLWSFLSNSEQDYLHARIEFIFDIIAQSHAKDYSTFLKFENIIKQDGLKYENRNAIDLWDKTKKLFGKFMSWYNDRTIYHYVGFLLLDGYKLHHIIDNSYSKKSDFKLWLKEQIKNKIKGVDLKQLSYDNKELSNKVLLLFNILTMENLICSENNRFPFNLYKEVKKNGGWSIEHIHAQHSEQLKDEKAIRKWLEETLTAINGLTFLAKESKEEIEIEESITEISFYNQRIISLLNEERIDVDDFNKLREEIIKVFDSESVHEIDNLALLSKKDNSSLNNSIFPVKRNKIIQLEKEGKFIPPCTRNVFLKFYSKSDNQPYYWSSSDKQDYFDSITSTINSFIN